MMESNRETPAKYFIYADDDVDDRNVLVEMIAEIDPDLQVVGADNGTGVVNYLKRLSSAQILPCFILLDINMPVMDGFATLKWLKSDDYFSAIPAIVFTTSRNVNDVQLATRLGAERFISKPFSLEEMKEITRQFADYCHELPEKTK